MRQEMQQPLQRFRAQQEIVQEIPQTLRALRKVPEALPPG